jgi:hypothetical protein
MEPRLTTHLPNLLHIPLSQPKQPHPNAKELQATNAATRKAWMTYCLVLSITRDQFAAAIDDVYYAVLDNPIKGLNSVDLRTLVTHILMTYAQISQPDLDNNLMDFNTGIDLILPLAVYTRKQEKCQILAHDANVPISNTTMVTTVTKHALAIGNMTLVWRKWKRCPITDHTWPNWKAHWTVVFDKMRKINRMTVEGSTFGANATEEEEQGRLIASSLDNLTNASTQKNLTINSLVAINAQLMQVLVDMQIAMGRMSPPMHAPPYSCTIPAWGFNPLPTAAPPAAPGPPQVNALTQCLSHWGAIKPNWDKMGYCWTHGFRVKVGHNSTTCLSRCTGHQPGATQGNIMGGSQYNKGLPGPQCVPPRGRVYC